MSYDFAASLMLHIEKALCIMHRAKTLRDMAHLFQNYHLLCRIKVTGSQMVVVYAA